MCAFYILITSSSASRAEAIEELSQTPKMHITIQGNTGPTGLQHRERFPGVERVAHAQFRDGGDEMLAHITRTALPRAAATEDTEVRGAAASVSLCTHRVAHATLRVAITRTLTPNIERGCRLSN